MTRAGVPLRVALRFPDAALAQQEIVTLADAAWRDAVLFSHEHTERTAGDGSFISRFRRLDTFAQRKRQASVWHRAIFSSAAARSLSNAGSIAAIIDAPSDQQGGWGMSDEFRLGADPPHRYLCGSDDGLKRRFPGVPLFLMGTSRGTISAGGAGRSSRFTARPAPCLTSTMFRQAPQKSKGAGRQV